MLNSVSSAVLLAPQIRKKPTPSAGLNNCVWQFACSFFFFLSVVDKLNFLKNMWTPCSFNSDEILFCMVKGKISGAPFVFWVLLVWDSFYWVLVLVLHCPNNGCQCLRFFCSSLVKLTNMSVPQKSGIQRRKVQLLHKYWQNNYTKPSNGAICTFPVFRLTCDFAFGPV